MYNIKSKNKYIKLKNLNKYFPNDLDVNLLICSKECSHAYLGTSKFKHICDICNTEFKALYHLKYKLNNKSILRRKDIYEEMPILKGNLDKNINWIDDISYDDLINGKVDCIGNIDEIYVSLAICNKDCKSFQLIVDGAPQVCPKCGQQMFRIKTKNYKLIKEESYM